jgi:hypothetical protein
VAADTPVDVSDALYTLTRSYAGVADRSAQDPAFLLLTAQTRTLRCSGVRSVAGVPVLAASEDGNDTGAGPLGEAVLREAGGAGTVHGLGVGPPQPDAFVELPDGEQPGVSGQLARRRLKDRRRLEEIEDWRPNTC